MKMINKSELRALLTAQEDGMRGIELPDYDYVVNDEIAPSKIVGGWSPGHERDVGPSSS